MGIQERKEREREQRKLAILAAAHKEFAANGVENTSMDRIAQAAELAKGTLYLYFKNRDEILLALVTNAFMDVANNIERIVEQEKSPVEMLLECVEMFWRFANRDDVLMHSVAKFDSKDFERFDQGEMKCAMIEVNKRIVHLISSILQKGIDQKIFSIHEPLATVVIQLMIAMKGSMILLRSGMMPPDLMPKDQYQTMQSIITYIIKGLMYQQPLTNKNTP
jgi:TetR/AcrR family transcriptional regulator